LFPQGRTILCQNYCRDKRHSMGLLSREGRLPTTSRMLRKGAAWRTVQTHQISRVKIRDTTEMLTSLSSPKTSEH
jgi:hypothetical protein